MECNDRVVAATTTFHKKVWLPHSIASKLTPPSTGGDKGEGEAQRTTPTLPSPIKGEVFFSWEAADNYPSPRHFVPTTYPMGCSKIGTPRGTLSTREGEIIRENNSGVQ